MKKRGIFSIIIFSILTLSIYELYWIYNRGCSLEEEGHSNFLAPIIILLLSIFVTPVGFALFGIAADKNLAAIKKARGLKAEDNALLYVLIGIFLPLILVCLVQYEINKLVEADENSLL